jgi:hypothetical protein
MSLIRFSVFFGMNDHSKHVRRRYRGFLPERGAPWLARIVR